MPQGVTRSNRVLKNIRKDQDIFHATREFCTILAHRQRRSKSEIAKFKDLPGNLLATKKLQTRTPIVKGIIFLRNKNPKKSTNCILCPGTKLWKRTPELGSNLMI